MRLLVLAILLSGCTEARQVNPGAVVPVYGWADMNRGHLAEFHSPPEAILFPGPVPSFVPVHEATHLYEARLEAAGDHAGARIVRHAFRDLCGPTWEIGHNDLLTELP